MAPSRLSEIVQAGIDDAEAHLVPVVEKELIHYDILASLEQMGLLERLVFHGGTCLRLCYGAQRRSEDLDFAYHGELEDLDLQNLETVVNESLGQKYGLAATVQPPRKTTQFANAQMKRWWLVVDTAPERPDLPSQKLKIEIISVETLTREIRRIERNYDFLSPSHGNTLAVCETLDEILADKIVSFVNTPPSYVRNRDAWDIAFLLSKSGCDRHASLGMVERKRVIYGSELGTTEFAEEGVRRTRSIVGSTAFAREMNRFMPHGAYEQVFGSQMKRQFAVDEICSLYSDLMSLG